MYIIKSILITFLNNNIIITIFISPAIAITNLNIKVLRSSNPAQLLADSALNKKNSPVGCLEIMFYLKVFANFINQFLSSSNVTFKVFVVLSLYL